MKNWTKDSSYAAFLILLRAGLWDKKALLPRHLSVSEWNSIWKMATEHTVMGLVFEGINTLPDEQKPSKNISTHWILTIIQIERQNLILDKKAKDFSLAFKNKGIKTVLLKGQGVARDYIKPERRQPGDIDLFVCNGKIIQAKDTVKSWGVYDFDENHKHINFKSEDIDIELHRYPIGSHILPLSKRLNRWLIYKLNSSEREFYGITLPDEEFNIVFEFYHMFQHFMKGGVGLRQLCDWCRCLQNAYGKVDVNSLEKNLYRFGILHSWKIFGCVVVKYMGMNLERMPLYDQRYEKKSQKIMNIIMTSGNFGRSSQRMERPDNYILSKIIGVTNNLYDTIRLFPILPTDAIRNIENPIDCFRRVIYEIRNKNI